MAGAAVEGTALVRGAFDLFPLALAVDEFGILAHPRCEFLRGDADDESRGDERGDDLPDPRREVLAGREEGGAGVHDAEDVGHLLQRHGQDLRRGRRCARKRGRENIERDGIGEQRVVNFPDRVEVGQPEGRNGALGSQRAHELAEGHLAGEFAAFFATLGG